MNRLCMNFKRIARVPVCARKPDPNRTGCTATAIRGYGYLRIAGTDPWVPVRSATRATP